MAEIKLDRVTKRFGHQPVLTDVTTTLLPGQIYGLLGRNGAGKSTLLNLIANRNFLTSGAITLDGENINNNGAALSQCYLMSEVTLANRWARVSDLMVDADRFYGHFNWTHAREMLQQFGINERARLNKLSTGLRTAAKLTIALNVNANYVFLDEPTLGLDAGHRQYFYQELLKSYQTRPRTFVLSTHLINEAANLLNRVLILHQGRLLVDQPVSDLLARFHTVAGPTTLVNQFAADLNVLNRRELGRLTEVIVMGQLPDQRPLPDQVTIEAVGLQDAFMALTKEDANHDVE